LRLKSYTRNRLWWAVFSIGDARERRADFVAALETNHAPAHRRRRTGNRSGDRGRRDRRRIRNHWHRGEHVGGLELGSEADIAIIDIRLGVTGPSIARALFSGFGLGVVYFTVNPALIENQEGRAVVTKPASPERIVDALSMAAKNASRRERAHPPLNA